MRDANPRRFCKSVLRFDPHDVRFYSHTLSSPSVPSVPHFSLLLQLLLSYSNYKLQLSLQLHVYIELNQNPLIPSTTTTTEPSFLRHIITPTSIPRPHPTPATMSMKQVKILKRPSSTPPPQTPLDRATGQLSQLLESALQRERTRLETIYRTRQDALLRAVSTVLNDTLERVVTTAARRETEALTNAFTNLSADAPAPAPDPAATRDAFAHAFEQTLLPGFEAALAEMLKQLAARVETSVEVGLLTPASGVVHAVQTAADDLRSVRDHVSSLSVNNDASDAAAVQRALDEGNVKEALLLAVGKSVYVRAKAVSGVLDLSVGPEEAFGGVVPDIVDLVKFAAVLSMDLHDRTEARLTWLYEIVALMDDVGENGPHGEEIDACRRRLEGIVERLLEFQKVGKAGPAEMKHTKLLVKVLKAHLNALEPSR